MVRAGLILEGGALRGVYTSGVLDAFMEKNLYFSDVYAVSAGGTNALSYISKQKGRTIDININYVNDKRYLGVENYLRDKSLFGFDFIFDDIANNLVPFDYETYEKSEQRLVLTATNCNTGEAEYFEKSNCNNMFLASRASASMPYFAPIVYVNNIPCLDGGISDAIPVKKAFEDGLEKVVVVTTRDINYRKKVSNKMKDLVNHTYKYYPKFRESLIARAKKYNETVEEIIKLEKEGKILVIRPMEEVKVSRIEKDISKLKKLYMKGYSQTIEEFERIIEYLEK